MASERDTVIVGGGPAGLAAALALAQSGLRVTVVDGRRPPLDKACGEGVMPAGLAALSALGVELGALGRPYTGIRYVVGDALSEPTVAEADFPGGAVGRGLRRIALHGVLAAAAERAGVELRWGESATGLLADGVATSSGKLSADFVVGADGLRSKVRRWADLERPRHDPKHDPVLDRVPARFGVRRHYRGLTPAARVEVIYGRGAEAYLTPVGIEEVGVALLWEGEARGFDELLASRFPAELAARFAGAESASRDRGAGPFRQRVRGVVRGPVALVGDAAGYVDPLTGEGLSVAFREALALASAIAAGDLAAYARASARIRRLPEAITRLALVAARRPVLARRLVLALARDPALFSRLLGALGAAAPAGSIGLLPLTRFALRLAGAGSGR